MQTRKITCIYDARTFHTIECHHNGPYWSIPHNSSSSSQSQPAFSTNRLYLSYCSQKSWPSASLDLIHSYDESFTVHSWCSQGQQEAKGSKYVGSLLVFSVIRVQTARVSILNRRHNLVNIAYKRDFLEKSFLLYSSPQLYRTYRWQFRPLILYYINVITNSCNGQLEVVTKLAHITVSKDKALDMHLQYNLIKKNYWEEKYV